MIEKKDISIIIQGPISEISLNNLDYYCEFGEVIISTWSDQPFNCDISKYNNLKFLVNPLPKIKIEYNYGNFYFQCLSTLNGLNISSKKYSFKTRSDESFSNLTPIIENFKEGKIVTTNISSAKDVEFKYHPSDHLIFSETYILKNIYQKCASICENPEKFDLKIKNDKLCGQDSNKDFFEIHAECILGKVSCETILSKEAKQKDSIKNMKKCFEIVPLYKLGNFKFSCNSSRHNKNAPYYKGVTQDWFSNNPKFPNSIDEI